MQQIRLLTAAIASWAGRIAESFGRLAFTAYVAAFVTTTLPLLWAYLLLCRPGRHADRAAKWWSRMALTVCGMRPRVTGIEHLRDVGAAILVANHASYIDSVVLMATIPTDFRFVAKRRLADYPLIGTVIRRAGHVTIEKATVAEQLIRCGGLGAPAERRPAAPRLSRRHISEARPASRIPPWCVQGRGGCQTASPADCAARHSPDLAR